MYRQTDGGGDWRLPLTKDDTVASDILRRDVDFVMEWTARFRDWRVAVDAEMKSLTAEVSNIEAVVKDASDREKSSLITDIVQALSVLTTEAFCKLGSRITEVEQLVNKSHEQTSMKEHALVAYVDQVKAHLKGTIAQLTTDLRTAIDEQSPSVRLEVAEQSIGKMRDRLASHQHETTQQLDHMKGITTDLRTAIDEQFSSVRLEVAEQSIGKMRDRLASHQHETTQQLAHMKDLFCENGVVRVEVHRKLEQTHKEMTETRSTIRDLHTEFLAAFSKVNNEECKELRKELQDTRAHIGQMHAELKNTRQIVDESCGRLAAGENTADVTCNDVTLIRADMDQISNELSETRMSFRRALDLKNNEIVALKSTSDTRLENRLLAMEVIISSQREQLAAQGLLIEELNAKHIVRHANPECMRNTGDPPAAEAIHYHDLIKETYLLPAETNVRKLLLPDGRQLQTVLRKNNFFVEQDYQFVTQSGRRTIAICAAEDFKILLSRAVRSVLITRFGPAYDSSLS